MLYVCITGVFALSTSEAETIDNIVYLILFYFFHEFGFYIFHVSKCVSKFYLFKIFI